MPDESKRRYLYVAIDRATRWVHLEVLSDKMAKMARKCLKSVIKAAPFHIKTVLTDNGKAIIKPHLRFLGLNQSIVRDLTPNQFIW